MIFQNSFLDKCVKRGDVKKIKTELKGNTVISCKKAAVMAENQNFFTLPKMEKSSLDQPKINLSI